MAYPFELQGANDLILARKGALHEKLAALIGQMQLELADGSLAGFAQMDPAYLAGNILERMLHSGDPRILATSLARL